MITRLLPLVLLATACSSPPHGGDTGNLTGLVNEAGTGPNTEPDSGMIPQLPRADAEPAPDAACADCLDASPDATPSPADGGVCAAVIFYVGADPECRTLEYTWNVPEWIWHITTHAQARLMCQELGDGWDIAQLNSVEERNEIFGIITADTLTPDAVRDPAVWIDPDQCLFLDENNQLGLDPDCDGIPWRRPMCERTICGAADAGYPDTGPPAPTEHSYRIDPDWPDLTYDEARVWCQALGDGWDLVTLDTQIAGGRPATWSVLKQLMLDNGHEGYWQNGPAYGNEGEHTPQFFNGSGTQPPFPGSGLWPPMCEGHEDTLE